MKELEKPIGRVFRRLRTQRFLSAFVWALAGWLAAATAVLAVDKFARPIPGPDWLPFAVAGGAAVLTALLVAIFTGPTRVDAAVAIDRAFQLNERLSTTLTLPEDLRETPAGRALVSDTVKHVADLDVADRFGLKMPRRALGAGDPGARCAARVPRPRALREDGEGEHLEPVRREDRPKIVVQEDGAAQGEDRRPAEGHGQGQVRRGREAARRGREGRQRTGQGAARREGQGPDGAEQADRRRQGPAEGPRLAGPGQPPAPAAQADGQGRPGRRVHEGPGQGRLRQGRQETSRSSRRSSRRAR